METGSRYGTLGSASLLALTSLALIAAGEAQPDVEGLVISVDRAAATFTLENDDSTTVVQVTSETVVLQESDFPDFTSMAIAFERGAVIEAEAEGRIDESGVLVADEVRFTEGEVEEEEEESRVEGLLTAVDRMGTTFAVDGDDGTTTVRVTTGTIFHPDSDFPDFTSMADAFEGGAVIRGAADGWFDGSGILVATQVDFRQRGTR